MFHKKPQCRLQATCTYLHNSSRTPPKRRANHSTTKPSPEEKKNTESGTSDSWAPVPKERSNCLLSLTCALLILIYSFLFPAGLHVLPTQCTSPEFTVLHSQLGDIAFSERSQVSGRTGQTRVWPLTSPGPPFPWPEKVLHESEAAIKTLCEETIWYFLLSCSLLLY